jgi:hypothetical protein
VAQVVRDLRYAHGGLQPSPSLEDRAITFCSRTTWERLIDLFAVAGLIRFDYYSLVAVPPGCPSEIGPL